jgi:chloramphenicol 3-O-phosphotransferase
MKVRTINEDNLPLTTELRVVGARCFLSTNSQEVLSSFARWEAPTRGEGESSFELRVLVDPAAKREKDRVPHFRGLHHLVFGVFGADETIVFDLARRRISAVVSDETARDAAFWNARFLPTALGLLGATIGVVPLHCACLDRGGEALLLAGVSRAGKSTLAIALSRLGFSVVSDGWTYIGRDGDQLTAHGISAPVKLLPDAVEHFPELRHFKAGVASNGELAFEVDVAGAFHATMRQQSTPRWVMFLERVASQGCEIVPYGSDAARAFLQDTLERLPVQLQEAIDTRAALVASLAAKECWLAHYGGPPQAVAETIARFCERA